MTARNIRHVWFIALNTLRLFLIDRLAVGMFILFPFLFIVLFNIMLADTGSADPRMVLHLTTQETTGLSHNIIQSLVTPEDEASLEPGAPVIIWEQDYDQAKTDVTEGKIAGCLAFPADFSEKVLSGEDTALEIIVLPESTNTRMALHGLAQSISASFGAANVEIQSVIRLLVEQGASETEIQAAIAEILADESSGGGTSLINYEVVNVGEVKPFNASTYVVPGYLVMFVFFAAAMASTDIIRERRNRTLERMLATSVRKESILGGIYLGGVLRGLLQIVIFWGVGYFVFKVDLGFAPWAVFVLSFLMVLMSAAFSVMLATLVRTERSVSALAVLVSLILAPLGGCWWPLFIAPKWMQFIAKLTPHGWANDGFNKLMLFGATGGDVMWSFLILFGFTAAFIIVAILRFKTSE
ncbi:MAG: ABC transporter permease [Dehalococcoidales bacterium]|nr:ABC transporter permease [Dehalococcoidales bacterium]